MIFERGQTGAKVVLTDHPSIVPSLNKAVDLNFDSKQLHSAKPPSRTLASAGVDWLQAGILGQCAEWHAQISFLFRQAQRVPQHQQTNQARDRCNRDAHEQKGDGSQGNEESAAVGEITPRSSSGR